MKREGIFINPETGDLKVDSSRTNGIVSGLQISNTDTQNVWLIVRMAKGELKNSPLTGVGIVRFLNTTGREKELLREVNIQLELDGYTEANVRIENGQLLID